VAGEKDIDVPGELGRLRQLLMEAVASGVMTPACGTRLEAELAALLARVNLELVKAEGHVLEAGRLAQAARLEYERLTALARRPDLN